MSAVTSDDFARQWAERLEKREAARRGVSRSDARKFVAARLGIAAGTLENLSRQRLKGVREMLMSRLRSAVIHEIRSEIAAHTHELKVIMGSGRGPGDSEVQEVVASLARLEAVISGQKGVDA